MTDWLAENDRALCSHLARIRAMLQQMAGSHASPAPPEPAPVASPVPAARSEDTAAERKSVTGCIIGALLGKSRQSAPPRALRLRIAEQDPPPPSPAVTPPPPLEPDVDASAQARTAAASALDRLCERLKLSPAERDTLLLAAGMELDLGWPELCARAQDDPNRRYPTFALALHLFDGAWGIQGPSAALRAFRLVEISQPGAQPLLTSRIAPDPRIVDYLKGLNSLDDRLAPYLTPLPAPLELAPSQVNIVDRIVEQISASDKMDRPPVVALLGYDPACKRQVASQLAAKLGATACQLGADQIPTAIGDIESFAALWQREQALLPLILFIDAAMVEPGSTQAAAVRRLIERCNGLVLLATTAPWPGLYRRTVHFDVARPTIAEQRALWLAALPEAQAMLAARLAGQFDLDVPTITRLARQHAGNSAAGDHSETSLWQACVDEARPDLERLAARIEARADWEALILPDAERRQLERIVEQVEQRSRVYDDWGFRGVMSRGFGISVLFSGESGTGKTMAAEVIARRLSLPLHRVDLSSVVNKYIGETEKNIRALFDAAERGGAMLLLDECDALMGRRTEIKDSHDRYANIEINYLLQRIESYRGLAVLATNMKSALDTAFLRRLRFIIDFPFPGHSERYGIWRNALPPGVPVAEGIDYERLAKFNLSGGHIHNAALAAAFAAAARPDSADRIVTLPLLLDAVRAELKKLNRPINEADFRLVTPVGGRR